MLSALSPSAQLLCDCVSPSHASWPMLRPHDRSHAFADGIDEMVRLADWPIDGERAGMTGGHVYRRVTGSRTPYA